MGWELGIRNRCLDENSFRVRYGGSIKEHYINY